MIQTLLFALSGCMAIGPGGDHILAGDLARALPEWGAVAPETKIALAPAPGIERVLRIADLRRLAAQWKVPAESLRDICFVRPVAIVSPEKMIAAMHEALPEARVELIDSSRVPAPDGVLEFPPSGLRAGYWYGYVTYGAGRRFSVWARVRVSVPLKQFIASADLKAGQSIEASSVTQAVMWTVLAGAFTTLPTPLESATGYVPRRTIPAGTAIRREWLEPPKLIQRGDMVKVEVVSRSAKIELTARAEASGALGEFILIENPDSKRRFRARVEAAGRVSVKGSL